VTVTVTLSAASATQVTVAYATANGTATAGSDYTAKSGTLTFAVGVISQTITISLNPDKTKEPNETFLVNLSNAVGATIADSSATVTITDDDTAMALTASEPAPGGAQADRSLTQAALKAAVAAAKAQWLAADPDAGFASVTFSIEDLPGLLLGQTTGSHVVIDATAAGWGWNVMYADGRPHMDLVTAVAHELGHVLGYEHEDGGLMAETLSPTVRERATMPAAPAWIRSPGVGAWVRPRPAARVVSSRARDRPRAAPSAGAAPRSARSA
jgi:hypothetical protein